MIGQSVGSDASPLSCFSSPQAPYRSFPPKTAKTHSFRCVSSSHRTRFAGLRREPCFPPITAQSAEVTSHTAWESPLQRGFKSHSHKRLTFAFALESGYTLAFANRIAHSGLHGETRGVSDGGWYHYPRIVLRGSETLRGRVSERQTLPLLGLGRGESRRAQRACGTAMRSCASLFRGVAAPQGRAAPLLVLALYRRASRLIIAALKCRERFVVVFACDAGDSSLVTAVRF